MIQLKMQQIGDWTEARAAVGPLAVAQFKAATLIAVRQEAQLARREIVTGIRKGAPGGKKFKKLAPSTLAKRRFEGFRGRKPLIRRGDLRNSVMVKNVPNGAFVGILRSARGKKGENLANIGSVHEEGRIIVMPITPKMRKMLNMIARKSGRKRRPKSAGAPGGMITIKIPPRPFLQPVFDQTFSQGRAQARMEARVSLLLRKRYGFVAPRGKL